MKRQCGSDAFRLSTSVEDTYLSDLHAGRAPLPSRNHECGKTFLGVGDVLAVLIRRGRSLGQFTGGLLKAKSRAEEISSP